MSKENKPDLYVGPHNEPMFQDDEPDFDTPIEEAIYHGKALAEPGSLMDREGIAYNRESYFR